MKTTWHNLPAQIDTLLANQQAIMVLLTQEKKSMSDISDAVAALTTRVTAVQGTEASALVLIQGIVAQLNKALADAADDVAAVAAVKALTAQLQASDDPLAAAVMANQPKPANTPT